MNRYPSCDVPYSPFNLNGQEFESTRRWPRIRPHSTFPLAAPDWLDGDRLLRAEMGLLDRLN